MKIERERWLEGRRDEWKDGQMVDEWMDGWTMMTTWMMDERRN